MLNRSIRVTPVSYGMSFGGTAILLNPDSISLIGRAVGLLLRLTEKLGR